MPRHFLIRLGVVLLTSGLLVIPAAAQTARGGNGTIYAGGYRNSILVIDEATEKVEAEIPLRTGMSRDLVLSDDRTKFYSLDISYEYIETIDIASRSTTDSFTLSSGGRKVRIRGVAVAPSGEYAILLIRPATKRIDRWEIEPATLVQVELASHAILRTIPWPDDEEQDGISMQFSPDGESLYFMDDDIIVYETAGFTETDRWKLSAPLEPGFGRIRLGASDPFNDEPGFLTRLFRLNDATQGREMMGVARLDLAAREVVDVFTLGPSEPISFSMAPDRKTAYGLLQQIHHYELWTIDLETRRVVDRHPFRGRPRMALTTSSNGTLLYIYQAGNTIDLYDVTTKAYLRTMTLDVDLTTDLFVMPRRP